MSLFFLILSLVTFGACHLLARFAKPRAEYSYRKAMTYQGSKDDFKSLIHGWVTDHENLELYEKTTNKYIIHEKPSLFFYGYFYHIKIVDRGNRLRIKFYAQPKLVSTGLPKKAFEKMIFEDLVIEQEEAS